jgi:CRP/FNR family transcriptional regulator
MSPVRIRKTRRLSAGPVACRACDLNEICRLAALIAHRNDQEWRVAGALRTVAAGAPLFRSGDPANSIFAVRQGMIKIVHVDADGHERIVAFHAPGEVIGLESFSSETYRSDATALEPSVCCELPLAARSLETLRAPEMLTALVRLVSAAAAFKLTLARGTARERITRFLLDLSSRLERRGFESKELKLSMSREEIANLLDTRVETVSRILQSMHKERLISVRGRTIHLLSLTSSSAEAP